MEYVCEIVAKNYIWDRRMKDIIVGVFWAFLVNVVFSIDGSIYFYIKCYLIPLLWTFICFFVMNFCINKGIVWSQSFLRFYFLGFFIIVFIFECVIAVIYCSSINYDMNIPVMTLAKTHEEIIKLTNEEYALWDMISSSVVSLCFFLPILILSSIVVFYIIKICKGANKASIKYYSNRNKLLFGMIMGLFLITLSYFSVLRELIYV